MSAPDTYAWSEILIYPWWVRAKRHRILGGWTQCDTRYFVGPWAHKRAQAWAHEWFE